MRPHTPSSAVIRRQKAKDWGRRPSDDPMVVKGLDRKFGKDVSKALAGSDAFKDHSEKLQGRGGVCAFLELVVQEVQRL